jgi:hypothetical protein
LSLWHAVEPKEIVGIYRTYWSIMDRDDPSKVVATQETAILEPSVELTRRSNTRRICATSSSRPVSPSMVTTTSVRRVKLILHAG